MRVIVSLIACATVARACSCSASPTTCELLATTKVVFVGTVKQGTELDHAPSPARGFGAREAVVTVENAIRGLPQGIREVRVNPSVMTSCYFEMKPGERFVIFGGIDNAGVVHTGGCSGSRVLKPGTEASVLRQIAAYQGGPSLFFGDVRIHKGWDTPWRKDNLAEGVEVALTLEDKAGEGKTGETKKWSTRTAASGTFEAEGLPPGDYQLKVSKAGYAAEVPGRRWSDDGAAPGKVTIPAVGCVEAAIVLRPDTLLAGTVLDVDGKPVSGVDVAAFEQQQGGRRKRVRGTKTDAAGRYEIPRLSAGKYIVGVNAEMGMDTAQPVAFHPASQTEHGAHAVELEDGKHLSGIDIVTGRARKAVKLRVRVVWPDGRPAYFVLVNLKHPENGRIYSRGGDVESGFTDRDGFVSVPGYEGVEYTVEGTWQKLAPGTGATIAWHRTNPVKFLAAPDAEVKLVLRDQPDRSPF